MLTGGYLSKLLMFAVAVDSRAVTCRCELSKLRYLLESERNTLLSLAQNVELIKKGEPFCLTDFGEKVALEYNQTNNYVMPFRRLLTSYIICNKPAWAFRIPAGRQETISILDDDTINCLRAAGLLYPIPDDSVIDWWNEISNFIRSVEQEKRIEIGYKGERATILYETSRTHRKPRWISFESNFAGYDILSVESVSDSRPRLIEVKSSCRGMREATFFISNNEWDVAQSQLDRYRFHLWLFSNKIYLADLPAREIYSHIPKNSAAGQWRNVEIPYEAFEDKFVLKEESSTIPEVRKVLE